jgi:hypothetical protein
LNFENRYSSGCSGLQTGKYLLDDAFWLTAWRHGLTMQGLLLFTRM